MDEDRHSDLWVCRCGTKTRSKKSRKPRHGWSLDQYGKVDGEIRIRVRYCQKCKAEIYIKQTRYFNENTLYWGHDSTTRESEYYSLPYEDGIGDDIPPGTSASEYTHRISRGADSYVA